MEQSEHTFTCPYCWKTISMVLDPSAGTQSYVEDCENCCHPILITYTTENDEIVSVEANRAQ